MPDKQEFAAIVTGGGTGIGKAISLALARQGLSVAVVYSKSRDDAERTVYDIEESGGVGRAIAADVSDAAAVAAMVAETAREFSAIRYLVNNAGITKQLPFADLDAVEDGIWDELYATNVKGVFNCVRSAVPHLRKTPGAAILNIGSIAGETGYGSSIPYAASKAALHGLTKSLARALAPAIRVNCLAPGAVLTRWWRGNEDKMHTLSGTLPLQRISTPDDIADTAMMLLGSPSVTGQVIRAENGQTL